jgi:hexosaminidase
MYFNQDTFMPFAMADSAQGMVEHINGDLFRFVPGAEFAIAPGDSLVFEYMYNGVVVKENLAPTGAYFVINADTPGEKIVKSGDIKVLPFKDLWRVFPDSAIVATVPSAANEYVKNQRIPILPPERIGKIIPTPYQVKTAEGSVELNESTVIYHAKGLENEAAYLAAIAERLFDAKLPVVEGQGTRANDITLELSSSLRVNGVSEEAYSLNVAEGKGVWIKGADAAGLFYGIQSLLALIPPELYAAAAPARIDAIEILDAPRFAYRGFLLDVARNFQQKTEVLKLVDLLALYKINKLNIRITDDEGWRIEISGLPELTQVGARRGHTNDSKNWLPPSFGSGPYPDSENNRGTGYYTREDFKEIIAYAAQRHIQVIPEVCFPSHARAAIKAMEARHDHYMKLGQPEKAKAFRLIDPDDRSVYYSAQSYTDNIANVALASTYHFYETVVKDFIAMYEEAGLTMRAFNTGGDEVPNGAWAKSPLCVELMRSLSDISNARQLQGYFLEKTLEMLEKYDLQITGWEEIVLNKDSEDNISVNTKFIGKNVLPLVWDNTGSNIDLGYRIANAGYPAVLCNVSNLYFDLAYNTDPREPGLVWGGYTDALDPYVMTPFDVYKSTNHDWFGRLNETAIEYPDKERLKPENRKNIVGLQAQLWSETVKGPNMMEYYVLPKLFAFAEKAWAQAPGWESETDVSKRVKAIWAGWGELSNRIGRRELPRLDYLFGGFNYRIPPPGAIVEDGMLKANVAFPGLVIRYTTDGSTPDIRSPEYRAPVAVEGQVVARAFNALGRGGWSFPVN